MSEIFVGCCNRNNLLFIVLEIDQDRDLTPFQQMQEQIKSIAEGDRGRPLTHSGWQDLVTKKDSTKDFQLHENTFIVKNNNNFTFMNCRLMNNFFLFISFVVFVSIESVERRNLVYLLTIQEQKVLRRKSFARIVTTVTIISGKTQ